MNCSRLTCRCECGGYGQPLIPWLTDEKHLAFTCMCLSCEKKFTALFLLADLFKGCPLPDLKQLDAAIGEEITEIAEQTAEQTDEKFLKECGIKFTAP